MLKRTLILFGFIGCSLFFISCSNIDRPEVSPQIDHYQITHVNVVDVVKKAINYDVNVEVKQGVIVAITHKDKMEGNSPFLLTTSLEKKTSVEKTTKIKKIMGKGKYLIPGLWDNHSSLMYFAPEVDYPLYIANGVTSIRSNLSCPNEEEVSFYACMKEKSSWKKSVEDNKLVGPSLRGWGTFPVNGYKRKQHPDLPKFSGGVTVEETKKLVDHYSGYPENERPYFIKVYNWLSKESFLSLSKYANEKGFNIAGHKPRAVSIKEAVDGGQRSFAHARLFLYDCTSKVSEVRSGKHRKAKLTEFYPWLMANFDESTCQKKYQYMADNNVYLNPTLMTRRNDYYGVAGYYNKMQGLEYAHYLFAGEWEEDLAKHGENLSQEEIDIFKDFYHLTAKTVADAQKAGVKILAGSDSWSEYNVPGFSLHEEMQALSDAGIDNFSVLQAASINGAEYFNISDKTGSIDIGKQADMVLLDANPINDIKNAQQISVVFKGKQIYQQATLNELKSGVQDIANSHLFTAQLVMRMLQNPSGF